LGEGLTTWETEILRNCACGGEGGHEGIDCNELPSVALEGQKSRHSSKIPLEQYQSKIRRKRRKNLHL
jgi:hypothetical protein